jgi:hypothetical protein
MHPLRTHIMMWCKTLNILFENFLHKMCMQHKQWSSMTTMHCCPNKSIVSGMTYKDRIVTDYLNRLSPSKKIASEGNLIYTT